MIAPIQPPKRPTRSPSVERARHLLTTALWRQRPERPSNVERVGAWKVWLFGGMLIAVAVWFVYLAIAAEF
jgi:hypothetical protein